MRNTALTVLLFLIPMTASAAGFAPGALFLSRSPVTEGDSVRLYAVVTNPATSTFAGKLVFKEGSTELSSVAVSLAAGATQTLSTAWKPAAGSHTVVADLEAQDGTVAQEQSATFSVQAKPQPVATSSQTASTVESSQGIQNSIGGVSPQAESAVSPTFNFIDGARQAAADALDGQIASVKPKVTSVPLPGEVEGASTSIPSSQSWFSSIFYTLYFYLLTILRFIVGSAAVFYPLVALLFLWFLWRGFRLFRRA